MKRIGKATKARLKAEQLELAAEKAKERDAHAKLEAAAAAAGMDICQYLDSQINKRALAEFRGSFDMD